MTEFQIGDDLLQRRVARVLIELAFANFDGEGSAAESGAVLLSSAWRARKPLRAKRSVKSPSTGQSSFGVNWSLRSETRTRCHSPPGVRADAGGDLLFHLLQWSGGSSKSICNGSGGRRPLSSQAVSSGAVTV